MKQLLIAAAVVAASTLAVPASAADVGVTVHIGDPGFYGRIDIGGYPPPQVIYRQPRVVVHEVERPPIYMRVPPGHAKHWSKHCHKYNACGERVYFVQDNWYNREYAPRYREQHHESRNDGRDDHGSDHDGKHKHKKDKGHKDKGHGRDH